MQVRSLALVLLALAAFGCAHSDDGGVSGSSVGTADGHKPVTGPVEGGPSRAAPADAANGSPE